MKNKENYLVEKTIVESTAAQESHIINYIIQVCANHYNIAEDQYKLNTRRRDFAMFRQTIYYFIKKYFSYMSLSEIGSILIQQDHATVLHAIKTIKDLYETDKSFKSNIDTIDLKIAAHINKITISKNSKVINLNDVTVITINDNKHIVLNGMDNAQIRQICEVMSGIFPTFEMGHFSNTGTFIINNFMKG